MPFVMKHWSAATRGGAFALFHPEWLGRGVRPHLGHPAKQPRARWPPADPEAGISKPTLLRPYWLSPSAVKSV